MCHTRDNYGCTCGDMMTLEAAQDQLCGNCDKDTQIKRLTAHVEMWKELAQSRYTKMVDARLRLRELDAEQEAADCQHAHFYMLPEAPGTAVGMELMEYGCWCEGIRKEPEVDECARCKSFKREEEK